MFSFLKNTKGVTLVELIISITIISILVGGVSQIISQFSRNVSWVHTEYEFQSEATGISLFGKQLGQGVLSVLPGLSQDSTPFDSVVFRNDPMQQVAPYSFLGVANTSSKKSVSVQDTKGLLSLYHFPLLGGIAINGNSFFLTDTGNHVIRELRLDTSANTVFVGSGSVAGFSNTDKLLRNPQGITLDASGDLFIADFGNRAIRKYSGGVLSTIIGTDQQGGYFDGAVADALIGAPAAVAVTGSTIYFSDFENHVIRKIDSGTVSTVAGTGEKGNNATTAADALTFALAYPTDITLASDGSLYIADYGNRRVLQLLNSGTIRTLVEDIDIISLSEISGKVFLVSTEKILKIDTTDQNKKTTIYTFTEGVIPGKIYAASENQQYVWIYDFYANSQYKTSVIRINTGTKELFAGNQTTNTSFLFSMKSFDVASIQFHNAFNFISSNELTSLDLKHNVGGGGSTLASLRFFSQDNAFLSSVHFPLAVEEMSSCDVSDRTKDALADTVYGVKKDQDILGCVFENTGVTCSGTLPSNAVPTEGTTYASTAPGNGPWSEELYRFSSSAGKCTFTCLSGYQWNGIDSCDSTGAAPVCTFNYTIFNSCTFL